MAFFKKPLPDDFDSPTLLPQTAEQSEQWQQVNRTFWENNPMRYDWKKKVDCEEFSKEFYREIDHRFFQDAREYLPWRKIPFDALIDFDALRDKDVLEIGVGSGSHAQLLAEHARSFVGIDLTAYAVKSTSQRMERFGLNATILQMDAEQMAFEDNSFDFIWSWGVIHHSSNTRKILQEMHRILRPGGRAITMVYHRNFWHYYVFGGLFHGVILGDLLKTRSIHKTVQRCTDGGLARYYSIPEWKALVSEFFAVEDIRIVGSKAQLLPLPGGKFKNAVMAMTPNPLSRFLTNRCRLGSFLVSSFKKG
jgi:ubiquinone/menaquinone biosynthesis C-methylase UbiE